MTTGRGGYVATRHGQVHFRELGTGAPLVLLHATPRSSRVYRRLAPHLAARHRVVMPDNLGFGESGPLPPGATMEMLAEAIADLIDDLGIGPVPVFGLHTGNKIGASLAADCPDRVSRFICCGMTHSIVVDRAKRDAAIRDIVEKYFAKEEESADGAHLLRGWARTFEGVSRTWWSPDVTDAAPLTEAALEYAADEVLDRIQARASFDAVYRANFAFDLADALGRVIAPTLILELATPGEAHLGAQADACAALMRDAATLVLEASDRDVLERHPERLATAILDFLAS